MNDESELRLVTPFKETQIAKAQRQVLNIEQKKLIKTSCTLFNISIGRHRVHNERMIGDLCKWAAARGTSNKITYRSLERCKLRIEVCRGLTNYIYRQRKFG